GEGREDGVRGGGGGRRERPQAGVTAVEEAAGVAHQAVAGAFQQPLAGRAVAGARSRHPCRIVVYSSLIHHAPFAAAEKCCASVCSSRGRWSGKNLCRRYPSGRLPPETLLFQARAYGRANDWGYGLKTAADGHGL